MAHALHHVTVVTADAARVGTFLEQVLGLPPLADLDADFAAVASLLGWPATGDQEGADSRVRTRLFGSGAAGLVEVVDCPSAMAPAGGAPAAGLAQVAMHVPDLVAALAGARALPADQILEPRPIEVAGRSVLVAAVLVAGARFQLTQTVRRVAR